MVVPVLMTSCHVSEKPNNGPLTAQTTTILAATIKVEARPAAREVLLARSPKNFDIRDDFLRPFYHPYSAPLSARGLIGTDRESSTREPSASPHLCVLSVPRSKLQESAQAEYFRVFKALTRQVESGFGLKSLRVR